MLNICKVSTVKQLEIECINKHNGRKDKRKIEANDIFSCGSRNREILLYLVSERRKAAADKRQNNEIPDRSSFLKGSL